jgi:hypothetical protein
VAVHIVDNSGWDWIYRRGVVCWFRGACLVVGLGWLLTAGRLGGAKQSPKRGTVPFMAEFRIEMYT